MPEKLPDFLAMFDDHEPHIFPFLWLHGEDEATLRSYMGVIHEANIRTVCLESRPHPDFLGPAWWHDLDILLDEAKKFGMKIWILDDSHFPTGYANGVLHNAPAGLCRSFLTRMETDESTVPQHPLPWRHGKCEKGLVPDRCFDDDRIISVTEAAEGRKIVCHVSRNRGPHRSYINMLSTDSCRVLIDTVYEAHYAHYADEFGKTILGFFSDEPELGNDHLYEYGKRLWELDDLPWSDEAESLLRARWGAAFEAKLPLLWDPVGTDAARARFDYMDVITRLVESCFSRQIGDWCHAHGVRYIGHLIEDNNQHTRTGSSLGHYFRGLSGQDMAGIDDIGNQVLPQGEWNGHSGPWNDYRDGMFYHYTLGKLGASMAAIDPKKNGRCMCEIFGNYGWQEGVKLEKYLTDHFLVRGVNHFVPHAFSPKEFPDPDCPPHFYAHGNNPQYRHFGALMSYMDRMCALLSGGKHVLDAAILYNAVAEWTGDYCDLQDVAAPLYDSQIDYDFIPEDVFGEPNHFILPNYRLVLVPGSQYITKAAWDGLRSMQQRGVSVWLIEREPEFFADCEGKPETELFPVVPAAGLAESAQELLPDRVKLSPENDRIRILRYQKPGHEIFFLVNEGKDAWEGDLLLPVSGPCAAYNAWTDRLEKAHQENGTHTAVHAAICPGKPLCLISEIPEEYACDPLSTAELSCKPWNTAWDRSQCESIRYPAFEQTHRVSLPDDLANEQPRFSGFVRYEKKLHLIKSQKTILEITDAAEGVELFVNGISLGLQISAPYRYDLTGFLRPGDNRIAIEVATTLERALCEKPACQSGLCGEVLLWTETGKGE